MIDLIDAPDLIETGVLALMPARTQASGEPHGAVRRLTGMAISIEVALALSPR